MSRSILEIVNLECYPISNLESPRGCQFLKRCRATMRVHGYCSLDGFIREPAQAKLVTEANAILPLSRKQTIRRNVYGSKDDPIPSVAYMRFIHASWRTTRIPMIR